MSFSLSDFHPLVLITGDFVSFLVLADILPYGRLSLSSFILLFISVMDSLLINHGSFILLLTFSQVCIVRAPSEHVLNLSGRIGP